MKNKIVFLSFHNWETKRKGGFHEFAKKATDLYKKVVFFSFARPYYIYFKKDERLNRDALKLLSKGKYYTLDNGKCILNITLPTLSLPGPFRKFFTNKIVEKFETITFKSKSKFFNKYFKETDVFVFESNECLYLFNILKNQFPNSKFIYRPSDPLIANEGSLLADLEKKIIKKFDHVFIVNQEGLDLYKNKLDKIDFKYSILSNGVDIDSYFKTFKKPDLLKSFVKSKKTALYLGARDPEWDLIVQSAKELVNINFIIITPSKPSINFNKALSILPNLFYINGINPEEVPAWVTNVDIIIVPNPRNRYQLKPWGITAKYYQAMAANKPIISYHDTKELLNVGVEVTYSYEDFIERLGSVEKFNVIYGDFLKGKDWESITNQFFNQI